MTKKTLLADWLAYFKAQGKKGGKLGGSKGGTKAAANMTAAERKARAAKGGKARAKKAKG